MGSSFLDRYRLSLEEDTPLYNLNLSTEMIAPQVNDYVVNALNTEFEKIANILEHSNFKTNAELFKDGAHRKVIATIESIIKERFGFDVRHLEGTGCGYAVFPVSPKNSNILSALPEGWQDELAEEIKGQGKVKDKDSYKTFDPYDLNFYAALLDNFNKLDKTVNSKGVVIDLQHAKIRGLPSDYYVFIMGDHLMLMRDFKLTPAEMTAVLLHEIGHAFTHLEYSYRAIRNTSVLIDTFVDNFRDKNKPFKESLLLAYQSTNPSVSMKELKDKNTIAVAVAVFEGFVKDNVYLGDNMHSYTDSEQLADNFAGRFGVGYELASGLSKMTVVMNKSRIVYGFGTLALGILGVFIMLLAGAALGPALVILGLFTVSFFTAAYNLFFITDNGVAPGTYDNDIQRLSRIKLEMIRRLRTLNLPKEATAQLVDELEQIDKFAKNMRSPNAGLFNFIYTRISSTGKRLNEFKKIEQLTEKLMENDLYVASAKLKLNM